MVQFNRFAREFMVRLRGAAGVCALIAVTTLAVGGSARANTVVAGLDPEATQRAFIDTTKTGGGIVLRVQRHLSELGLYRGALDGRVTAEMARAIRLYQRRAELPVDGMPSFDLLERLELAKVVSRQMLWRLDAARERQLREAWRALDGQVATGGLVAVAAGSETVAAAATGSSACFAAPTPTCLLAVARATALSVPQAEFRDWAFGELAVAQATVGDGVAALATAGRMIDPRLFTATLGGIARAQTKAGDYEAARLTARAIPDDRLRDESLTAITAAQLTGGNPGAIEAVLEEAFAAVGAVAGSKRREVLLGETAGVRAKLGGMIGTAPGTETDADTAFFRVRDAVTQAETGDVSRALATARAIDDPHYRAAALREVALVQARSGARTAAQAMLGEARAVATTVEAGDARARALGRIANAQARTGGLAAAFDTADAIAVPAFRARALWTVALYQAGLGLWEAARRSEARAETVAAGIDDDLDRIRLLADIALLRRRAGDALGARAMFDRALGIAEAFSIPWLRVQGLSRLAIVLAEMDGRSRDGGPKRP